MRLIKESDLMSNYDVISESIRGNIMLLDPRSKLIATFVIILALNVAIELSHFSP